MNPENPLQQPGNSEALGVDEQVQKQKEEMDKYFASIVKVEIPEGDDKFAPSKIIITDKDGEKREFEPTEVIKILEKDGVKIVIEAQAAYHIYSLHISGEAPGSTFEKGTTLADVAQMIKDNLDFKQVDEAQKKGVGPLLEKKFVGAIDTGKEQFKTGVATFEEAIEKGIVSPEEIQDFLDNYKDKVEQANLKGDLEEQAKIKEEFNQKGYKVYLDWRFKGSPLLVFFDAEPISTSKMTVVIRDGKLITTMTGEPREKLPFSPQSTFNFIKEKDPQEYARLKELFGSDEEILKKLKEEFEINSKDWTQAGFIQKRESK